MALLAVENLEVSFQTRKGLFKAVENFSLEIGESEILSIVGESGSGKSVAMLGIMGLLPDNVVVKADKMEFQNQNLLKLSTGKKRKLFGKQWSMIFQDPINSLNPCFSVGSQVAEMFTLHRGFNKRQAKDATIELFKKVGIAEGELRYNLFPHQMSGGMNQRVMIAMAIALEPRLLIADEPTTALDVTIQAQILRLILEICQSQKMSLILITHNMGVVFETAEKMVVQYAGMQMEQGLSAEIFAKPYHPYTQGLLDSNIENAEGDRLKTIPGSIPLLSEKPSGCMFYPRCTYRTDLCQDTVPYFQEGGRKIRCFHYKTLMQA